MVQRAKVTASIAIVDLSECNCDNAITKEVNKVLAQNKEMFIVNTYINFKEMKAVVLYKEIEE